MRFILFIILIFSSIVVAGQETIDPSKLPLVPYKPGISGVDPQSQISIGILFTEGLKVILADQSFKVIQFDVVYDCHSRSLFDFSVKRYRGDKVDAKDEYFRKRVLAGDLMDIINTVIEKDGVRYRMKEFSFIVIN
jgi:hypothetical protein